MDFNTEILQNTILFKNLSADETHDALNNLSAKQAKFKKNEIILHAGEPTSFMGLVLSGSVTIENSDLMGNRSILSHVGKGGFFAETYALLNEEPMMVDVIASEDCEILFLQIASLRRAEFSASSWAIKMTSNLLLISAHKNLNLSHRSFHTAPKTIRGRVWAYLNSVSMKKQATEFDIPFDRQQLADYLNIERSALSKELGKMQKDGLITVKKNHFVLHEEF